MLFRSQKALEILTRQANAREGDLTHHEFTNIDGRPFVRYAKGQLMKQTCVKCHNADEKSPKRDWQEGDLAGVLVVTRPLDRDIARTRSGLRSAFLVMGVIAILPVVCSLGLLARSRWKNLQKA